MTGLDLRKSERDLLAWTDRWIPPEILTGDETRLRRARNLIVVVLCGTLIAVFAGFAHLLFQNNLLGILATSFALPAAGILRLFWQTQKIATALHSFLLFATLSIAACPIVVEIGAGSNFATPAEATSLTFPLLIGLIPIPAAAAIVGGGAVGLIWTALISTAFALFAVFMPSRPMKQS